MTTSHTRARIPAAYRRVVEPPSRPQAVIAAEELLVMEPE
jgi:hypothetical protein